jgi:hypothetical protein
MTAEQDRAIRIAEAVRIVRRMVGYDPNANHLVALLVIDA